MDIVTKSQRIVSAQVKASGAQGDVTHVVRVLDAVAELLVVDESSATTVVVVGHDVSGVHGVVSDAASRGQVGRVGTEDLGHPDLPSRHAGHGGNVEGDLRWV